MDSNNLKISYLRLIEALRLAASSADVQLKQFPINVCRPDEVALTFDEETGSVDLLVQSGFIAENLGYEIKMLNNFYGTFNKSEEWTEKGMAVSTNWEESRQKARHILARLGVEEQSPRLFWITDLVGKDVNLFRRFIKKTRM